ncbi:erythropoietin [Aplochiton taeniatus]
MKFPRLFALLLMLLKWTRPGLPAPMRPMPICDLRVLDHFIKEAKDTEAAMRLCKEGCSLSEPVTVPQTRVDFLVWETKNALEQAQEVQSGLWLLNQALGSLRTSVTNAALHGLIDINITNLLSITNVLRSLNIQEYVPQTGPAGGEGTWRVSSASELLTVHVNFLRGKVRLLPANAPGCQDVS